MRINKLTYTPVSFAAQKKKQQNYYSPVRAAATTTAIWFGFGVVSTAMTKKLSKILNSDKKSAWFLNIGFALTFGIIDGIKTYKRNRRLNNNRP